MAHLDPSMSILVADDMSMMLRLMDALLRKIGFADIDCVHDGTGALGMMHAKRYGLVISDLNMEPMSGLDLLRAVRADEAIKNTPFILTTANASSATAVAAKRAGVSTYIVKPFGPAVLKEKVEAALLPTWRAK